MPRLSLIVITRNEEANIGRCLSSCDFVDEIIVVDSGSFDKTQEIAKHFKARFIRTLDWRGFGLQKNRALDAATGDWIISLDADEWIEPELAAEIRAAIAEPNGFDGFEMPRRSRFCGRVIRHSGWWPDPVLRLFRRSVGRFTDAIVHEKVVVNGRVGRLSSPIEHDSITDLDEAHEKTGRYAAAAAAELIAKGATCSIVKAVLRANWAFFKTYLLKRGFLDGAAGTMIAAYNATYTYQKWARVAAADTARRPRLAPLSSLRPTEQARPRSTIAPPASTARV
jgi:glycosyltransferase involved in cell wall biosynthesis